MYEYTMEEVQAFLESKSTDKKVLKRSLERRGYEVSNNKKRGADYRFILNSGLKPKDIEFYLGYKPKRPETTRVLVSFLLEQGAEGFKGSYKELKKAINSKYGIEIGENHIGDTYRELVASDKALASKEARSQGFKELRVNGQTLTEDMRSEFFETLNTASDSLRDISMSDRERNEVAWSHAQRTHGHINSVPFKIINFVNLTEDAKKFFTITPTTITHE